MVVCFAKKKNANLLISQDLIKIGRETAYTKAFQEQNLIKDGISTINSMAIEYRSVTESLYAAIAFFQTALSAIIKNCKYTTPIMVEIIL